MTRNELLEMAEKWEQLAKASAAERGPFTKRFCSFKAAQLRQQAEQISLEATR